MLIRQGLQAYFLRNAERKRFKAGLAITSPRAFRAEYEALYQPAWWWGGVWQTVRRRSTSIHAINKMSDEIETEYPLKEQQSTPIKLTTWRNAMKKRTNAWRRQVLISLIGSGLLSTHLDVLALSKKKPPEPTLEDNLRNADLIIVGEMKKILFSGTDVRNRAEYNVEFDSDSDVTQRRRQANVVVKKVLSVNKQEFLKTTIRIDSPTVKNGGYDWISGELIFVLKKGWMEQIHKPVFICLVPPVQKNDSQVLSTLRKLQKQEIRDRVRINR